MPQDADFDDPVSTLLDQVLELPGAERPAAVERLTREHPEHAATLRARLRALERLGFVDAAEHTVLDRGHESTKGLTVPQQLDEFTLRRQLGGGGMGVVWLARDERLHRDVAVKVVRPEHLFFERSHERFHREVEAVARLNHPGIVPIYSVGEAHGVPYYAMELLAGCSLAEALAAVGKRMRAERTPEAAAAAVGVPESERAAFSATLGGAWTPFVTRVAMHVARALEHAHVRGVVHRDVKPSNVMLTRDARVLLVDFGLAAAAGADALTRTGAQMGSLPYSSPEQVRGDWAAVDARSDVFSLGCVLYEMLAFRPAFEGATQAQTVQAILSKEPPDLRRVDAAVPADLEAIVQRCLEKEPARRYASAGALAADLEAFLEHRPVSVRPLGRVRRLARFARREPLRAGLVATSLVAVLALALFAFSWPSIRAGRAEARAQRVEQLLEQGFAFADVDRERARAAFEEALRLAPQSREAAAGMRLLERRPATGVSTPPPLPGADAGPLELFLAAEPRSVDEAAGSREQAAIAVSLLRRAALMSPRRLYVMRLAQAAGWAGDVTAAREAAAVLAYRAPDDPWARWYAGLALLDLDPRAATEHLSRAVELDPAFAPAWGNLGLARWKLGDAAGAEAALQRAIALNPNDARAHVDLAQVYLATARPAEALRAMQAAVVAAPDLPGAHYNLGCALQANGDLAGAERAWRRTVELAPRYVEAWSNLGTLRFLRDDASGALECYDRVVELQPNAAKGHHDRALALWKAERHAEAVAALERVLELEPEHADAKQELETLRAALAQRQESASGR